MDNKVDQGSVGDNLREDALSILEVLSNCDIATFDDFFSQENFRLKEDGGIFTEIFPNFRRWFLDEKGKDELPKRGGKVTCSKLRTRTKDCLIVKKLDYLAETCLSEMFYLVKKQKDGEEGSLLVNGCYNKFFISEMPNVVSSVQLYFRDGWRLGASKIDVASPDEWRSIDRVFTRNLIIQSRMPYFNE